MDEVDQTTCRYSRVGESLSSGDLEKEQLLQLLDIIVVTYPVVAEDVAVVPGL